MHEFRIERVDDKHVATCTCKRWRSSPYVAYSDAEKAGLAHIQRGDDGNRARAQFERGESRLTTQLNWYRAQADSLLNSPRDRQQWQRLAEELARRIEASPQDGGDQTLW